MPLGLPVYMRTHTTDPLEFGTEAMGDECKQPALSAQEASVQRELSRPRTPLLLRKLIHRPLAVHEQEERKRQEVVERSGLRAWRQVALELGGREPGMTARDGTAGHEDIWRGAGRRCEAGEAQVGRLCGPLGVMCTPQSLPEKGWGRPGLMCSPSTRLTLDRATEVDTTRGYM